MDWSLPVNLSSQGLAIDNLYYIILVMTAAAFVLVEAGIIWFVFQYGRGREEGALYHHGDNRLEVAWTAVTALAVVWLGIHSGQIWSDLTEASSFPDEEEALVLDVTAQQFEWMITYPGADGELGGEDDFTLRNTLHLPVDRPVIVELQSNDVIHSFFIPKLRVKQDALPGRTTRLWFEATRPAETELACAELCGLGHYRMQADVTIHPQAEFDAWHAEESRQAAAESGSADRAGASARAGERPADVAAR